MIWKYFFKLWIPVTAIILAGLVSLLPSYQRFEYLLNDSQQWLVSSEQYYDDVLMIDIDDRSLIELQPYFGTWPYTRDTYALLLDYLTEMGAKTIVLDILLTDPRKKDDLLAEAIDRNKNTVLITSAPADYAVLNSQEAERLSHFAWRVPIMLPMTHWKSVLTPAPELIKNTSSTMELGMASVLEDIDGTLRRIPLMHDVAGLALPSLPLATLASDELPHSLKYDSTRGIASYGENEWPIDTEGKIHLSFPKNPNSVLTMSFLQVAKAALGLIKLENSKSFFHDMTVFIGSTAYHADRVTTPRGVMSGTIVVAIAYQNLKKNTVLLPPDLRWNAAHIGLAVLSLLIASSLFSSSYRHTATVMILAIFSTYIFNFTLFLFSQKSVLLLPLLIEIFGWILLAAYQQSEMLRKNVSLDKKTHDLEKTNTKLEEIACIDPLTKLLTRRAFVDQFFTEIERSMRTIKPLSVAILDIDYFKKVNDTYGHMVGDLVLKRFSSVLKSNLRTMDIAGRWGGEEFVILLPATSLNEAMDVINRIRIAVSMETFSAPAESLKITMSAGITEFEESTNDPELIINVADKGLYEAKESGRNRICVA